MSSNLVNIAEARTALCLKAVEPLTEEIKHRIMKDCLNECILMAGKSFDILFFLSPSNRALRTIESNLVSVRDKSKSVEERYQVVQILLNQISEQIYRAVLKNFQDPDGPLHSLDLLSRLFPLLQILEEDKLEEGRQ